MTLACIALFHPSPQDEAGTAGHAPLVEFSQPAGATHVCLAEDASVCGAAHSDGTICLYDVAAARLRWSTTAAAAQGGVAALAVVQRLRGCKLMVAYRWAAKSCGVLWGPGQLGSGTLVSLS